MPDLNLLVSTPNPPSVIALAETWLDSTILNCEVQLPGYTLHRRDRDRHGGGVALFIDATLNTRRVHSHPSEELLWLEVRSQAGSFAIGVMYRPPGLDSDLSKLELAMATLH